MVFNYRDPMRVSKIFLMLQEPTIWFSITWMLEKHGNAGIPSEFLHDSSFIYSKNFLLSRTVPWAGCGGLCL
jgi:hypothetical protein